MHTSTVRSLLAVLLLVCAFSSTAQIPMAYDHVLTQMDDQWLVIFTASFPYGAGQTCPPFQAIVSDDGEQIQLTALYNTTGAWPDFFCTRTDTVHLAKSSCSLLINYAAIVHSGKEEEIIPIGEPDLISLCITGINEAHAPGMKVHPTLFQDRIWIEMDEVSGAVAEICLLDVHGRRVAGPWFLAADGRKELLIPDLAGGVHLLEVRQGDLREVVRVVKE